MNIKYNWFPTGNMYRGCTVPRASQTTVVFDLPLAVSPLPTLTAWVAIVTRHATRQSTRVLIGDVYRLRFKREGGGAAQTDHGTCMSQTILRSHQVRDDLPIADRRSSSADRYAWYSSRVGCKREHEITGWTVPIIHCEQTASGFQAYMSYRRD